MASSSYSYSTDHKPVPLSRPLWKIRSNRPSEWQEMIKILEESPKELFLSIITVPEIMSRLKNRPHDPGAEDSLNYTPSQFLNEICEYRSQPTSSSQDKKSSSALTFGWLLQTCLLSDIPMSCEFITFLSELQDSYSPIRFVDEVVKTGGIEVKENNLENIAVVELGSILEIEVQAEGVPSVAFQWYKLPPETSEDIDEFEEPEWIPLEVKTRILRIENFRLSDIGSYRCYVTHRIPVSYPLSHNFDNSKTSEQTTNYVGGTFSQLFDIRANPGSILITKSPKVIEEGLVGGSISLDCEAEIASEVTSSTGNDQNCTIQYQWYHDGVALIGQTHQKIELKQLWLESSGDYFCRVSNSKTFETKKGNMDEYPKEFCDTTICKVKVALPNKDQITSGEVQFTNEEIRILEQPDIAMNSDTNDDAHSSPSQRTKSANSKRRAAIGDKVSLSCTAVCKYPLKYEWLKQGIRRDLVSEPRKSDVYLPVVPVAFGSQLNDEVDENERVSAWTYRCIVTCPTTGQRVQSQPVTIEVSTFARTPEKSLPSFKIALVICQEVYASAKYFPPLMAPKLDGAALISALKQLDFQVLAFCNLTMDELKCAVDMFCSFIDRNTYALFYYNGHAIGHNNDVYLVSKDTNLKDEEQFEDIQDSNGSEDDNSFENLKLLWHGEIEEKLDKANPLLCTMIYDSCRSAPPETVVDIIRTESSRRRKVVTLSSNFFFAYGTRPSMKSFEKVIVDYAEDGRNSNQQELSPLFPSASNQSIPIYQGLKQKVSPLSQGLYMKHLLKHLTTPNLTVSEIFAELNSSFTREEDPSVVDSQRPMVNQSTVHFRLDAPLRQASCTHLHKLFFNMTRYESSVSITSLSANGDSTFNNRNPSRSAFDADLKYDLGLKWVSSEASCNQRHENLIWITGNVGGNNQSSSTTESTLQYNSCDNLLRVKVLQEPNGFNNEAFLILSLIGPRAKFESVNNGGFEDINDSIAIQLIPCNVELKATYISVNDPCKVKFDPCLKKAINGADGFVAADGPTFLVSSDVPGFESGDDELILGQCHMTNLQTAISDLKFRAILHFRGEKMMCPSSGGDGYGMKYGVMKFALPIIRNYPKFRMNNTIYQNV